jgi:hypothetical protein
MLDRNDALHMYTRYVAPQFTALESLAGTLFPLMAQGLDNAALMASPSCQADILDQLAQLSQIGRAIQYAPTPSPLLTPLDQLVREVGIDWQEIAGLFARAVEDGDVRTLNMAFSRQEATNAKMLEIRRQTDQLRRL